MDRIAAIHKSLVVYTNGVIGCIPLLGLPSAIYALIGWATIRREYRDWNPADYYVKQGALMGVFGVLLSTLVGFLIGYLIVTGSLFS